MAEEHYNEPSDKVPNSQPETCYVKILCHDQCEAKRLVQWLEYYTFGEDRVSIVNDSADLNNRTDYEDAEKYRAMMKSLGSMSPVHSTIWDSRNVGQ